MTNQAPVVLVLKRQIAATPEKVFSAWTDPALLKQWFGPTPEVRADLVEMDLRVGGGYRIGFAMPDNERATVGGEFVEVDPPRKLVYTWTWEEEGVADHPGVDTRVTVEFRDSSGSTELTLTHEQLANEEMREKHSHGWTGCLDQLEKHLERVLKIALLVRSSGFAAGQGGRSRRIH